MGRCDISGYVRKAAAQITLSAVITSTAHNLEYNQLEAAFNGVSGHAHDGSTGNAPKIALTTSVSGSLPVANGGTGATAAAAARTNLGINSIAAATVSGSGSAGLLFYRSAAEVASVLVSGAVSGVMYYKSGAEIQVLDARPNQLKVSANDSAEGYLYTKLSGGTNIRVDLVSAAGVEKAKISVSGVSTFGKTTIGVPASSWIPRPTSGASVATVELPTNKRLIRSLDFPVSGSVFGQLLGVPMPKSWDEGTFEAYINWTARSGSGDVTWGIQAVASSNGDDLDTAFGTIKTTTDTLIAADKLHTTALISGITVTASEGDLVDFQITREAESGSDTLTAVAKLISVKLLFTVNAGNDN